MKNCIIYLCLALVSVAGCDQNPDQKPDSHTFIQTSGAVYKEGLVKGKMIDSGFLRDDSAYHGIIHASDGNVYYFRGLST